MYIMKYGGKEITLSPYDSKTEKELLLISSLKEQLEISDLYNILKHHISDCALSEDEMYALIYKLRSISVGDSIPIKCKCNKCSKVIDTDIDIDNVIIDGDLSNNNFDCNIKEAFTENVEEYVDFDMSELEINDYEELETFILQNKVKFDFIKKFQCQYCKHINNMNLKDIDFLKENISEDTILTYYKNISDLVFFGHYSKLDIDSMLPFERNIYIGLLNKQLENQK